MAKDDTKEGPRLATPRREVVDEKAYPERPDSEALDPDAGYDPTRDIYRDTHDTYIAPGALE